MRKFCLFFFVCLTMIVSGCVKDTDCEGVGDTAEEEWGSHPHWDSGGGFWD